MVDKKIYIEYKEDGQLQNVYEVVLGSSDGTYGIKEQISGNITYPQDTNVDNPETGKYEKTITINENTNYIVSWKITVNLGDQPKYITQKIGPFSSSDIKSSSDYRGTFIQGKRATLFIKITNLEGYPKDPDTITCSITKNGSAVVSGVPEKIIEGYYAFDWDVNINQEIGTYDVLWDFIVDGNSLNELQQVVVSTKQADTYMTNLYSGRFLEIRNSLEMMISQAQNIPVYREQARQSSNNKTYMFTFKRWNQSPGCRIYLNGNIVNSDMNINYFKGTVEFNTPLTDYDLIQADYNFRWFSDEELDRFLSNGLHLVNLWPPSQRYINFNNMPDTYIPLVLYAASVDAIRNMMMSLMFQEPQMVFGGPEAADRKYQQLEGLKKNYEETLNKALEQKKYGPYVGLTRTIVTPEFSLPGGRSRWFRYLFSAGA